MKSLLFILTISISSLLFAQPENYSKYINGNLNVSGNNQYQTAIINDKSGSFSSNLNTRIGFIKSPNKAIGIGLSLNYTSSFANIINSISPISSTYIRSNSASIDLDFFIRRFKKITDQIYLTLDYGVVLGGGEIWSKHEFSDSTGVYSTTKSQVPLVSVGLYAYPSVLFFPKPSWSIEMSFGRLLYDLEARLYPNSSNTDFIQSYGLSFRTNTMTIGISKYF